MNVILFGFGEIGKIYYNILSKNNNIKYIIDSKLEYSNSSSEIIDINNKKVIISLIKNKQIIIIITKYFSNINEYILLGLNNKTNIFILPQIIYKFTCLEKYFNLAKQNDLSFFVAYDNRYINEFIYLKENIHDKIKLNSTYTINILQDNYNICTKYSFINDIDFVNWILNDTPMTISVKSYTEINLYYYSSINVILKITKELTKYIVVIIFKKECNKNITLQDNYNLNYNTIINNTFSIFINNKYKNSINNNDCLINNAIINAYEKSIIKNNANITIKYCNTFRNYSIVSNAISENYRTARKYQTIKFVKEMHIKYSNLNLKLGIWNILKQLNDLIDISDPDISHPNLYHAIQTAEMIRNDGHPEWLQLVGLIHDIGKIMYLKGDDITGTSKKKQWAMVGDTFIVGCKIPDKIIFPEFNCFNLDYHNEKYNTTLGIYSSKCGLDNVNCSWGHDEYLYRILSSDKNPNKIPDEGRYIIRYHSLYVYHKEGMYEHFLNKRDKDYFKYLKLFNKYDLYSKSDLIIDLNNVEEYYKKLITKFFTNSYLYI